MRLTHNLTIRHCALALPPARWSRLPPSLSPSLKKTTLATTWGWKGEVPRAWPAVRMLGSASKTLPFPTAAALKPCIEPHPVLAPYLRSPHEEAPPAIPHSVDVHGDGPITITFIDAQGIATPTSTTPSPDSEETLLRLAQDHNVDVLGECGGMVSCSTFHMAAVRNASAVGSIATQEELDMLHWSGDLTETSRLGCQVRIDNRNMDGLVVKVVHRKPEVTCQPISGGAVHDGEVEPTRDVGPEDEAEGCVSF